MFTSEIALILQPYLSINDIASCLLLNSSIYPVFKGILNKNKYFLIQYAKECIDLTKKTKCIFLFSTICLELLSIHLYVLKMNYNNITSFLVTQLQVYIGNKCDVFMKSELVLHRNQLILTCPNQIDLYMFCVKDLRSILYTKYHKKFSSLSKSQLIQMIRV